jgi:hypothetical protein
MMRRSAGMFVFCSGKHRAVGRDFLRLRLHRWRRW